MTEIPEIYIPEIYVPEIPEPYSEHYVNVTYSVEPFSIKNPVDAMIPPASALCPSCG